MGTPTTITNRMAITSQAPAAVGLKMVEVFPALVGDETGSGRSITRPHTEQLRAPSANGVPQSEQATSLAGAGNGIRGINRMVGIPQCGHWMVSPAKSESESNSRCPEQTLQTHRVQLPDGPPLLLIKINILIPDGCCRARTGT